MGVSENVEGRGRGVLTDDGETSLRTCAREKEMEVQLSVKTMTWKRKGL